MGGPSGGRVTIAVLSCIVSIAVAAARCPCLNATSEPAMAQAKSDHQAAARQHVLHWRTGEDQGAASLPCIF